MHTIAGRYCVIVSFIAATNESCNLSSRVFFFFHYSFSSGVGHSRNLSNVMCALRVILSYWAKNSLIYEYLISANYCKLNTGCIIRKTHFLLLLTEGQRMQPLKSWIDKQHRLVCANEWLDACK